MNKKITPKAKTLTLKMLNITNSNPEEHTFLISSFDVIDFATFIVPNNYIKISYTLVNDIDNIKVEEYSLKYCGIPIRILCGISLDNSILYENYQYLDCRENYYKNQIKNNKRICNNGVELDLSGNDCNYYEDGTDWENLAGFNEIVPSQITQKVKRNKKINNDIIKDFNKKELKINNDSSDSDDNLENNLVIS